jgi:hypothetical protein
VASCTGRYQPWIAALAGASPSVHHPVKATLKIRESNVLGWHLCRPRIFRVALTGHRAALAGRRVAEAEGGREAAAEGESCMEERLWAAKAG